MDSKITKLALDISGLIQNFVKNEVSVYKENYDHMMNSPLFNQLRTEVETLRAENLRLSKKKNNIELEINDDSEDTEYEFDRKYKNDFVSYEDSGLIAKAELQLEEAEEEEDFEYDDEIDDEEQLEVEEEQEQPALYTIRVDGQEVEVTLEELQNGYSRQQDYTRKTQELSQQRKTIEQQQRELAERDAIYAQLLPKMEAQISGELGNEPDWNQLYEDDPVGYVREKQLWDDRKEKLAAAQAEQQRLQQEAFTQQQQQYA